MRGVSEKKREVCIKVMESREVRRGEVRKGEKG
jgi:hypothetical protein